MANEKRLIDCGKMRSIIRNKILQYIDNQQFVDIMKIFLELLDLCPTVDAMGDDFQDIQTEQAYCNGKTVMREAVLQMLGAEEKLHRGSDQALIRYLIKKIERLEAE